MTTTSKTYWWQKPRFEDGDDMLKDSLKQEGKEIGITLNAAGTGILLQLGEVPTCHKCELHQIRVTLERDEAITLKNNLERLIGCLAEPQNDNQATPASPFDVWWHNEGSGMLPLPGEDLETHVRRICEIAWRNGSYHRIPTKLTKDSGVRD